MNELLTRLRSAGVAVALDHGDLDVRPRAPLTDAQLAFLRTNKPALVAELRRERGDFDHGVRGDGRAVSWDGFLLDPDGGVLICEPCDGGGCPLCAGGGLQLAFPP